jgi:acetyl esterase/lipase
VRTLAPEHQDPGPIEDCFAGLKWMAKTFNELGIDSEKLIVAGSSAGGGLAAGVSLPCS